MRPQTPQTPPALPPRRWTPSSSPTATGAPKLGYSNNNSSGSSGSSGNSNNHGNRVHHNNQGQGRNANRNSKVESPLPVGGRGGSRADIPMISFPDDDCGGGGDEEEEGYDDDEGEEDEGRFGGGPSIMVSGPDEVGPTRIVVSAPQISISGPDNGSSSSRSRPQTRSKPPTTTQANGPSSRRPAPQSHPEPNGVITRLPVKRRGGGGGLVCGGCDGAIIGRIVSAMGVRWHPGCFRCTVCNELLEHVSSYEHEGWPYCHLDYHEVRFSPFSSVVICMGN